VYIGCPVVSTASPSGSLEPAEAVNIHVRLPANLSDEARSSMRLRPLRSLSPGQRAANSLANT
jgi:hypothetical protein